MSDFIENRRHQTAIENSELDGWLKLLSPRVAVKVLDCCNSGVYYIKGASDLKEALEISSDRFETCYFLFSSQYHQASYADDKGSFFTRQLLEAIRQHADGPMRYREIMNALADAFEGADQQPQFAVQGSMLDLFCEVNDSVRSSVAEYFLLEEAAEEPEQAVVVMGIREAVEKNALLCISLEEAEESLRHTRELLEAVAFPDLEQFYETSLKFGERWDTEEPAEDDAIGKWLKKAGSDCFARAVETEPRAPSVVEAAMDPYRRREGPYVSGFVTTADLEYDRLFLRFRPKFPNLKHWELAIVILWSPRTAVLFDYFTALKNQSWKTQEYPDKVKWKVKQFTGEGLEKMPYHVETLCKQAGSAVYEWLSREFTPPYAP